jgi:hypothetical protein
LDRDENDDELPWARLAHELDRLVEAVMAPDEHPGVVIESTYGWYSAVDALQAGGGRSTSSRWRRTMCRM